MRSRLATFFVPLLIATASVVAAQALPASTPTGILADRVLPLAHLEDLDGSPSAPAAGLARWRQAVHELRRAAERDPGWPAPRALQDAALAAAGSRDVPLALLHARYDRMAEAGRTAPAEAFALAALRDNVFHGAAVAFTLDPDRVLAHGVSPAADIMFDPDDGGGPRALTAGSPLAASYAATGLKHPVLTARLPDGRTLTARTTIDVKRLATPEPHETWTVSASQAYRDSAGAGLAYVYLAEGHAAVSDPVVVVEGFDLDNSMDWPVLYDLLNRENMLEDLRALGFDAVVLDFAEATEPIQRNAFVLAELLDRLESGLEPGRTAALVGASMGGLVARYGLSWLERQGPGHRVRTFLSFDVPHLGANIPLGLQHWLEFFAGESEAAGFLLSRLDTPAARQMLLYHHLATDGAAAAPDTLRADFLADLAALGDWPAAPRLAAVANGSGAGLDQGFAPGDQLILYEYRSLLVDIDGNVWAVPDGGPGTVFDGMMNLIWPLPDTYATTTVAGTLPWDGAPGGFRASMAQMDTTAAPYGDIVALHDNHCFIPTVSALALTGVGPFHDVAGDPDLLTKTVFDAVYFPVANQEHIAVTTENKGWFVAEILEGLTAAPGPPPAPAAAPALYPAAPNPFNPRTTIAFALPADGRVRLAVYDLGGRLVKVLADGILPRGEHRAVWEGDDAAGRPAASGGYVCRLDCGGRRLARRLTLVR